MERWGGAVILGRSRPGVAAHRTAGRLSRAAGEPQRCAGVDTRWFSVGGRDGVRAAGRWRTFDILLKLPILVPPGQTARRLWPRACAR